MTTLVRGRRRRRRLDLGSEDEDELAVAAATPFRQQQQNPSRHLITEIFLSLCLLPKSDSFFVLIFAEGVVALVDLAFGREKERSDGQSLKDFSCLSASSRRSAYQTPSRRPLWPCLGITGRGSGFLGAPSSRHFQGLFSFVSGTDRANTMQ